MDASGSSAFPSRLPSPAPVAPPRELTAPGPNQSPVLDAFGNPLELPAYISPHRVFELLDQVLPFEICLYHRVLPLAEAGNQLQLGMVDPHDEQALAYVRRIVAYRDRTLTPVTLAGHLHQVLLSAYLNYASQKSGSQSAEGETSDGQDSGGQGPGEQGSGERSAETQTHDVGDRPTAVSNGLPQGAGSRTVLNAISHENTLPDVGDEPAVDDSEAEQLASGKAQSHSSSPQTLEEWELETLFPMETAARELQELGIQSSDSVAKPQSSTLDIEQLNHLETQPVLAEQEAMPMARLPGSARAIDQRQTLILDETEIMAQIAPTQTMPVGEPPTLIEDVEGERFSQPADAVGQTDELPLRQDMVEEVLVLGDRMALPANLQELPGGELSQRDWTGIVHLPPSLLLQAMLGRMLRGNITRLRLERCRRPKSQSDLAQLLWNPAGVLQPTWSGFSLGAFGALAKALRELAQLPLGPIQQPIQRGVMRRYHDRPILLLMQFLPGTEIAAIELRLLQKQALQSFQQRQGKDLRREALLTAQQLQYQVQQLLDHHQRYPEAGAVPEHLMAVIGQIEKSIANAT